MFKRIWAGLNDAEVVKEMLTHSSSHHWEECYSLVARIIYMQHNSLLVDIREDVIQDTMLSIVKSLPDFRYQCTLLTWIISITHNRIIDAIRKRERDTRSIPLLEESGGDDENVASTLTNIKAAQSAENECIRREELQESLALIESYLDKHAKKERNQQVALKVLFEGYSIEEAAKAVGVSTPVAGYTIRSLQRYLRESIKR